MEDGSHPKNCLRFRDGSDLIFSKEHARKAFLDGATKATVESQVVTWKHFKKIVTLDHCESQTQG